MSDALAPMDRRHLPPKCRRKQRLTEAEATLMAQRLATEGDAMAAYPCGWCGGWHVGHVMTDRDAAPVAPDARVPESVEAAHHERARLGAEMLALQNTMHRLKADRSQQGWWAAWSRVSREYRAKCERSAYLRAWLLENGAPPRRPKGSNPAPQTEEDLAAKIGPELAACYSELLRMMKASGADAEFRKVIGRAFGIVVAAVNGEDVAERAADFRFGLARWSAERGTVDQSAQTGQ